MINQGYHYFVIFPLRLVVKYIYFPIFKLRSSIYQFKIVSNADKSSVKQYHRLLPQRVFLAVIAALYVTGLEPALFSKVLYGNISNIASCNFSSLPHLFSNFSSEIINIPIFRANYLILPPQIPIFSNFVLLKKRH